MTYFRNDFARKGRSALKHDENYLMERLREDRASPPIKADPDLLASKCVIDAVACDDCGSQAGEPCFSGNLADVHYSRGLAYAKGGAL